MKTGTGMLHIYYGDGKGKSTAAFGLAFRAVGSGLRVLVLQFLKNDSFSGERKILETLPNVCCIPAAKNMKFVFQMTEEEKETYRHLYEEKLLALEDYCRGYDLLILDEAVSAIDAGMITEERLLEFLDLVQSEGAYGLEVVLTGNTPSERLLARADYVTCMKKIKHPYDRGQAARKGIEW